MGNQLPTATIYVIDNVLLLIGGSLPRDFEQNYQSDSENNFTSRAIFDIDKMKIYSKVVIELSSASCTLTLSTYHCKE